MKKKKGILGESPFVALGAALSVLFVLFGVLANPELSWVHPEYVKFFIPKSISTGIDFHWQDFKSIFDVESFDHAPRTRFLSYAFSLIAVKTRAVLFEWIPPIPSISPVWIISLAGIPWAMLKFFKSMGADRRQKNWMLIGLFSGAGFVSVSSMLFHPGKALGMFVVAIALWQATALRAQWNAKRFAALMGVCFVGLFADETAAFSYVIVVVLLRKKLWAKPNLSHIVYGIGPVLYFGFLLAVYPKLTLWSTGVQRDFFQYGLSESHWRDIQWNHFFSQVIVLFGTHTVHAHLFRDRWWAKLLVLIIAFLLCRSWWKTSRNNPLHRDLGWVFAGYLCFQFVLSARHPVIVTETKSSYYYGALFSLFWSTALGLRVAGLAKTKQLVFAVLCYIAMSNVVNISKFWISIHEANLWVGMFGSENNRQTYELKLSNRLIAEVWDPRVSPVDREKLLLRMGPNAHWLRAEMKLQDQKRNQREER